MRRQFYLLDVFTDRPLAGNPLAIVIDSDGLDAAAMQKIAAEFNLSETVFVLPPLDPVNTARLRIFTPKAELPFAGHPTIGAAVLIGELRAASLMRGQDVRIVLEEPGGAVTCLARHRPGKARQAEFALPKLPARIGAAQPSEKIAAALGLASADIGFGRHQPAIFSAGTPFTCVPIASLAALNAARPQLDRFADAFAPPEAAHAYLYARGANDDFEARMFAPSLGVFEDPATGSAAAAFAGALMQFEAVPDGHHALTILQGAALGRPSTIVLSLDVAEGALATAAIGGGAVIVADGKLDL
ncbi:PhzF family phenazine biosynthesis protein [uncultured Methylovirgula sp.]|uniref:PhzF family phenazine biosynthesis protein n=1 Tax=uncultured Methylovirgula sp. TaxID=1285960 RepID=UPI0026279763|nr:PhzF family phenazine biosynthesis protein [uncultured Methylovirgula sp.]